MSRLETSPKIGVALGSGASRGLAHIGVMRALEEQGLQVTFVAGTSMGAFIGSAYAAGNLHRLATDFLAFDWRNVAGLLDPVFPRSIRPSLGSIRFMDFDRAGEIIELGYQAAKSALAERFG